MASQLGADRFETRLERLFSEALPYADEAAFATRVQAQMARGRSWRTVMVGAAGVGGAVVAVSQALNANLGAVTRSAESAVAAPVHEAATQGPLGQLTAAVQNWGPTSGLGAEVVWMVAGLAVLGLAMLAARTFGET